MCHKYVFMGDDMEKELKEKAMEALKKQEKQYKRQNAYIKEAFDRVSVALPKGTKDRITATGESINAFINAAVADRLALLEETSSYT